MGQTHVFLPIVHYVNIEFSSRQQVSNISRYEELTAIGNCKYYLDLVLFDKNQAIDDNPGNAQNIQELEDSANYADGVRRKGMRWCS